MSQSPRPAGLPWVSPYLIVKDVDAAIAFYQKAFQLTKKDAVIGEDSTTWHAELKYKDQIIMIGKEGSYGKTAQSPINSKVDSPVSLYIYCENVDEFYNKAIAAGAVSFSAPEDLFWGDRMCRLKDLDGYTWCFATYKGNPG